MAQLMAKNLEHQDLVWVVPCVGDVDYPKVDGNVDVEAERVAAGECGGKFPDVCAGDQPRSGDAGLPEQQPESKSASE